jgi:hypothetical protein
VEHSHAHASRRRSGTSTRPGEQCASMCNLPRVGFTLESNVALFIFFAGTRMQTWTATPHSPIQDLRRSWWWQRILMIIDHYFNLRHCTSVCAAHMRTLLLYTIYSTV